MRQRIPDTSLFYPPPLLYCGPTALCAITGENYHNHVRSAINRARGKRPNAGVRGMRNSELVRVLAHFGWLASPAVPVWPATGNDYVGGERLPEMLRMIYDQGRANPSDILLVEVTRHYVTVQSNVVVDNHMIESLIRHPARRQRAKRAWQIMPIGHAIESGLVEIRQRKEAA